MHHWSKLYQIWIYFSPNPHDSISKALTQLRVSLLFFFRCSSRPPQVARSSRPRLSKVSSTPRLKKGGKSEKTFTSPLSPSSSGLHTSPAFIMALRRITKKAFFFSYFFICFNFPRISWAIFYVLFWVIWRKIYSFLSRESKSVTTFKSTMSPCPIGLLVCPKFWSWVMPTSGVVSRHFWTIVMAVKKF